MNDRAIIRSFETGMGRRVAILCAAVVILALVLGLVIYSFQGRGIRRNTDALIRPHAASSHDVRSFPSR
ncbi:MAG TPA: hypothetical protein VIU64_01790 [Polyangia bacterium]